MGYNEVQYKTTEKWSKNPPSLAACYKGLIEFFLENFPDTQIMFISLPAPFVKYNTPSAYNFVFEDGSWDIYKYRTTEGSTANYDEQLYELQKSVAELYGIKYINLEKICSANLINYNNFYADNNVHPVNLELYKRWAEEVYRKIK